MLVGVDNVMCDGVVVNKVGIYFLVLVCYDNGVFFYVVVESFKFYFELNSGDVELVEWFYVRNGYRVRNVFFDVIFWKYVRGIIMEFGIFVFLREI